MRLTINRPDCWLWQGHRNRHGYGWLRPKGEGKWLAHRWVYTLFCGPIPEGMNLLHRCDTPACVNPDHMRVGTQADNMADMKAKGRQRKGETHQTAKLTEAQALAIIADPRPHEDIAADYPTSASNVCLIKKGRRWKHLWRGDQCVSQ